MRMSKPAIMNFVQRSTPDLRPEMQMAVVMPNAMNVNKIWRM